MKLKPRIILDTNLLISRVLTPQSVTASAVRMMIDHCHLLVSQATIDELADVLGRIQRKGYVQLEETTRLIFAYKQLAEWVPILERITACRDPKDDKFLDLAVNGQAEYLVTGDNDLLMLNPFRKTNILSVREFIEILLP